MRIDETRSPAAYLPAEAVSVRPARPSDGACTLRPGEREWVDRFWPRPKPSFVLTAFGRQRYGPSPRTTARGASTRVAAGHWSAPGAANRGSPTCLPRSRPDRPDLIGRDW